MFSFFKHAFVFSIVFLPLHVYAEDATDKENFELQVITDSFGDKSYLSGSANTDSDGKMVQLTFMCKNKRLLFFYSTNADNIDNVSGFRNNYRIVSGRSKIDAGNIIDNTFVAENPKSRIFMDVDANSHKDMREILSQASRGSTLMFSPGNTQPTRFDISTGHSAFQKILSECPL